MSWRCPNCGTNNEQTSESCEECGELVDDEEE